MTVIYTYHAITNIPNTKITSEDGMPPKFTELTGMLEPLLQKLHRRNKNWQFTITPVAQNWRPRDTSQHVNFITVHAQDTGESLGRIELDNYERYSFTNPRISRIMARAIAIKTKDLTKAVRLIEQYFVPKGLDELLQDAGIATRRVVDALRLAKNGGLYDAQNALLSDEAFATFIFPNFGAIVEAVSRASPKMAERIQSIPEHKIESDSAQVFAEALNTHKCYTVIIRPDDQYVVADYDPHAQTGGGSANITVYTSEGLPPALRGKLAMLKLVGVGEGVSGVGVRVEDLVFFIPKEA